MRTKNNLKKCILILLASLWIFDGNAQKIVPSASNFEVDGSTYAWEVHDEGIKLILDNMTSMAGINAVYMIAVMHKEHRPYQSPEFLHNPVRGTWDAEDSRAYFLPEMSLYGRIKPDRFQHAACAIQPCRNFKLEWNECFDFVASRAGITNQLHYLSGGLEFGHLGLGLFPGGQRGREHDLLCGYRSLEQ